MMEKRPVKRRAPMYIACFLAIFLASCDQSPLFYQISTEIEPKEPRIKGVPSNFVEFNGAVYVGSVSLHRYQGAAGWDKFSPQPPGGRIYSLAATNTFLYALTESGLYKLVGGTSWTSVSIAAGAYSSLQSIYGTADTLFVGGWNGTATNGINTTNFAIFYVDDKGTSDTTDDTEGTVMTGTALLSGAVQVGAATSTATTNQNYYISTNGTGIYHIPNIIALPPAGITGPPLPNTGGEIKGLIDVGGDIIGVSRNGNILIGDSTTSAPYTFTPYSTGQRMTGAIALWGNSSGNKLLLLGIQPSNGSTSTIYGYREIKLDSSNGKIDGDPALRVPGSVAPSSVDNRDRYDNTLGTHPVNHLFQAPSTVDTAMTLFAGIQGTGRGVSNSQKALNSGGVWSYRNNQWNAEE